ncbi:hypothetical protein [Phenylobacterium sp. J367]|uniref:hypothetical protein n=1 Tax=Phenylobacterium sp. J367 TaxID=2898435 RepID=UPI002150768A|nr:hypothetical protein [Phenylobacterium sp. J367]MCR5877369.1 hypothetical protein [Phenylobacterium sp. J367]
MRSVWAGWPVRAAVMESSSTRPPSRRSSSSPARIVTCGRLGAPRTATTQACAASAEPGPNGRRWPVFQTLPGIVGTALQRSPGATRHSAMPPVMLGSRP